MLNFIQLYCQIGDQLFKNYDNLNGWDCPELKFERVLNLGREKRKEKKKITVIEDIFFCKGSWLWNYN